MYWRLFCVNQSKKPKFESNLGKERLNWLILYQFFCLACYQYINLIGWRKVLWNIMFTGAVKFIDIHVLYYPIHVDKNQFWRKGLWGTKFWRKFIYHVYVHVKKKLVEEGGHARGYTFVCSSFWLQHFSFKILFSWTSDVHLAAEL